MVIIMYDYKTLEFPKVLEILSKFTKTNYAKELIQNTCDSFSFNDALRLKKETEESFISYNPPKGISPKRTNAK